MVRAGRLRDVVSVQQRTETQDGWGQPVETWTDVFKDYAEVKQLTGREFFNDARVAADIDTRVVVRYRPGITAKHRVVFHDVDGDRVLDIQSVVKDQKRTTLEILCKEAG